MNRLFEMVHMLLGRERIEARHLAEHFGVSTRTIYRDVDVLSEAGIPVYTLKGKGGGIGLMPGFVLDRTLLTQTEQNEIMAALVSLSAVQMEDSAQVLEKLGALFGQRQQNWVEVDFSDWGRVSDKYDLIKKAILSGRVLEFTYYSSQNEKTLRRVEPCVLWFKSSSWYLRAYCLQREELRTFKITRMRNLQVLDVPCTNGPFGEQLAEPPKPPEALPVQVQLYIAREQGYRVYDLFDEEQIAQDSAGNFLITCHYLDDEWLYEHLLSFGSSLKVIHPEHVRAKLVKEILATLKNYRSP